MKRKNGKRKNSLQQGSNLGRLRDNHYTTPTADSVSEIKYLYMHLCL